MAKIKILDVPPGTAPHRMREQWVGIEIPLTDDPVSEKEIAELIREPNKNGYQTKRADTLCALREAGRFEAAFFWEHISGNFIFAKKVCALVI